MKRKPPNYKEIYDNPLYNSADKIVVSGIETNHYRSYFNNELDSKTIICQREVFATAAKLIAEITVIAKQLKEAIGNSQLEAYHNANGILLLKDLGNYYLSQAENALHATRDTRQSWFDLGNKYLKYSTYDFMRENKLLPPLIENEEEELMLQELKRQMEKMKLDNEKMRLDFKEQEDRFKEQEDQKNDLANRLIASEKNNRELAIKIEDLTAENLDLKDKLSISEQEKVVLQKKLATSEEKVIPLQKKVHELKIENKELKDDKTELREDKKALTEDKKMLIEYNKSLQEEKKLLLVDKKIFQDLNQEQILKIEELSKIHCNDPTHINLLHDDFGMIEQVELGGNLNQSVE
jgi:hypothetical protein